MLAKHDSILHVKNKIIKVASYLNTELHRLGQAIAKYQLPYTKILNTNTIFLILTNFNTFLKTRISGRSAPLKF